MIPIAGSEWWHVLNGERGAVRVLATATDDGASPVQTLVVFTYLHASERRSGYAVLPLTEFHKAYRGGGG